MIRVPLAIFVTLLFVGTAHAQMRLMEVPRSPSISTMPTPMPSVPQTPGLGTTPGAAQVVPPPPAAAEAQHTHAAEVCDCYRIVYDQQGRATRLFSGRSHQCCP